MYMHLFMCIFSLYVVQLFQHSIKLQLHCFNYGNNAANTTFMDSLHTNEASAHVLNGRLIVFYHPHFLNVSLFNAIAYSYMYMYMYVSEHSLLRPRLAFHTSIITLIHIHILFYLFVLLKWMYLQWILDFANLTL